MFAQARSGLQRLWLLDIEDPCSPDLSGQGIFDSFDLLCKDLMKGKLNSRWHPDFQPGVFLAGSSRSRPLPGKMESINAPISVRLNAPFGTKASAPPLRAASLYSGKS